MKKGVFIDFIKKSFKFGMVGVLNTAITLGIIYILGLLGLDILIANPIGYVAGFVNSFVMNKLWTFESRADFKKELFVFIIIFAICYSLQYGFLLLLTHGFSVPKEWGTLVAMVFYTGLNFLGNHFFNFKKRTNLVE